MSSPNLRIVIPALLVFLVLSLVAIRWIPGRPRAGLRIAQMLSAAYLLIYLLAYVVPVYGIATYDKFRPIPPSETRTLFQGIAYTRDVRSQPRPTIIHVVTIDLDAPGVRLIVTPPDPTGGLELRAQTVSHFLSAERAQLAINAGYFEPWWDNSLVDYYPQSGQPVDVAGFAASDGLPYSPAQPNHPTLIITADNRVSIGQPGEAIEPVYNAVSGNAIIVSGGQPVTLSGDAYFSDLHPRTAAGLDQTGRHLILVLVDGRQPGYSEGASLSELSAILVQYSAWTALNLDGGGSTDLVIDSGGSPLVLNTPIHSHIPGRERPVANQLGVFALPLAGASIP